MLRNAWLKVRAAIFWTHLAAGLAAGLVVLVLCVTGVLLTYERQMLLSKDASLANVDRAKDRLPLGQLLERASADLRAKPTALTIRSDHAMPAVFALGREGRELVDPTSGELRGDGTGALRTFLTQTRALHRWLLLEGDRRDLGRAITGAANLVFLGLLFSGLLLWIPKHFRRAAFAVVTIPRWKLPAKTRDWNWHNALGFWSSPVLLVLIVSGAVISYGWANDLVYQLSGTPRRSAEAARGGERPTSAAAPFTAAELDRAADVAMRDTPAWQSITLALPASGEWAVFTIDPTSGGRPLATVRLTIDRSGNIVRRETAADRERGLRWRQWLRFAHTGEILGVVGQTIAGLACAVGCVLVYTGIALSVRRFTPRKKRLRV